MCSWPHLHANAEPCRPQAQHDGVTGMIAWPGRIGRDAGRAGLTTDEDESYWCGSPASGERRPPPIPSFPRRSRTSAPSPPVRPVPPPCHNSGLPGYRRRQQVSDATTPACDQRYGHIGTRAERCHQIITSSPPPQYLKPALRGRDSPSSGRGTLGLIGANIRLHQHQARPTPCADVSSGRQALPA